MSSFYALLPHRWISRAMKHSQNDDALVSFAEIDAVRETSCDGFTHIAVQHGELFWCGGDALNQ